MEVNISHLDQAKFSIQSRSHTIFCDQPAENGGEDSGMTPPELMLASLGSCAAFYAVEYMRIRNLAQRGYEIVQEYTDRISGAKAGRPGLDEMMRDARCGKFDVVLVWASESRSTPAARWAGP